MSTIHEINEGWQEFALKPTWAQLHKAQTEYDELRAELQAARQEVVEQAKLNGMGAEREARLMAENAELKAKLTKKAELLRGCYARINTLERTLTHIHGVALAEDHRDLPGIAKDAKEALEKKHEDR